MIRFVSLSQAYWTDPEENGGPCCAFLDTVTDTFIPGLNGSHVYDSWPDIWFARVDLDTISRMLALVPPGFFSRHSDTPD